MNNPSVLSLVKRLCKAQSKGSTQSKTQNEFLQQQKLKAYAILLDMDEEFVPSWNSGQEQDQSEFKLQSIILEQKAQENYFAADRLERILYSLLRKCNADSPFWKLLAVLLELKTAPISTTICKPIAFSLPEMIEEKPSRPILAPPPTKFFTNTDLMEPTTIPSAKTFSILGSSLFPQEELPPLPSVSILMGPQEPLSIPDSPPKPQLHLSCPAFDWRTVKEDKVSREKATIYLSENKPEKLDLILKRFSLFKPIASTKAAVVTEQELIADVICAARGIPSKSFALDATRCQLVLREVRTPSTSSPSVKQITQKFASVGTSLRRLEKFTSFILTHHEMYGTICQSFAKKLNSILLDLSESLLNVQNHIEDELRYKTTLVNLWLMVAPIAQKIEFLSGLCHCNVTASEEDLFTQDGVSKRIINYPRAMNLLGHWYNVVTRLYSSSDKITLLPMVCELFQAMCGPFCTMFRNWIYHGSLEDYLNEFMVQSLFAEDNVTNLSKLEVADQYWKKGFVINETNVPSFMAAYSQHILLVGLSLNVIKLYDGAHHIFSTTKAPNLALHFQHSKFPKMRSTFLQISLLQNDRHKEHVYSRLKEYEEMLEEKTNEYRRNALERLNRYNEYMKQLLKEKAEQKTKLLAEKLLDLEESKAKKQREKLADQREYEKVLEYQRQKQEQIKQAATLKIMAEYEEAMKQVENKQRMVTWQHRRHLLDEKRIAVLVAEERKLTAELEAKALEKMNSNIEDTEDVTNVQPPPAESTTTETAKGSAEVTAEDKMITEAVEHIPETQANEESAMKVTEPQNSSASEIQENSASGEAANTEATISIEEDAVVEESTGHAIASSNSVEELAEPEASGSVHERSFSSATEQSEPSVTSAEPTVSELAASRKPRLTIDVNPQVLIRSFDDAILTPMSTVSTMSLLDRALQTPKLANIEIDGAEESEPVEECDVPIEEVIEECLIKPLLLQHETINTIATSIFFNELSLQEHLQAISRYFLMGAGDFADAIAKALFEGLQAGNMWKESTTLNYTLERTLKLTEYDVKDEYSANLSFIALPIPASRSADPHSIDAMDHIRLNYSTKFPLTLIIDSSSMEKYNQVFQFLLRYKRISASLEEVWHHFRHPSVKKSQDPRIRALQMLRHEMQHFMSILLGFIMSQIMENNTFIGQLHLRAKTILEIRQLHEQHLDNLLNHCLLSPRVQRIMNIITSIFSCIMKFRLQIINNPLSRTLSEGAFEAMMATQASFRNYTQLLFSFLTKLQDKTSSSTSHGNLLAVLNFNHFFDNGGRSGFL